MFKPLKFHLGNTSREKQMKLNFNNKLTMSTEETFIKCAYVQKRALNSEA